MKGTLHKREQGWVVRYFDTKKSYDVMYCGESLPLHPDDESLWMFAELNEEWKDKLDGKEVEFEIINETYDDGKGCVYAKLIPSKEQQKQLITEIMDLDAKDGLYDYPELGGTMAVCNHVINKRKEQVEDDVERFSFKHDLQNLINEHLMENGSDTPDFILASFLHSCLESFNHAVRQREQFYNKAKETLYTDLINWIDNEMLLNEQYKDSPRLKEGATMVKVHIQSLKQLKKD